MNTFDMEVIPLIQGSTGIVTGNVAADPPAIAFDRIVAACMDLEWQILPRVAQRGVKAARELDEEKSY